MLLISAWIQCKNLVVFLQTCESFKRIWMFETSGALHRFQWWILQTFRRSLGRPCWKLIMPNRRGHFIVRHDVVFQKTWTFINTTVWKSDLAVWKDLLVSTLRLSRKSHILLYYREYSGINSLTHFELGAALFLVASAVPLRHNFCNFSTG